MFIVRENVLQNMFCKHDSTQTTAYTYGSSTVAPQGALCYISGVDGDTTVVAKMTSCDQKPFGWLLQEVRQAYNHEYMPIGAIMAQDLGAQKTFVGFPVGVAHLGIADTSVYTIHGSSITAGDQLYPTASGTVSTSSGNGWCSVPVAIAMNTLTVAEQHAGRYLRIKCLL
jgi:hypothetical protein